MSAFDDLLDEYLGEDNALTDVRAVVRRLWFYDFDGQPVRLWDGQGKLFTVGGHEWLGSVDAGGTNHHVTPALQDGRDGSSATYKFGLTIPDMPGQNPGELYEEMKAQQSLVHRRALTCYLAIFEEGEALRPQTPIAFFKELTMMTVTFSDALTPTPSRSLNRKYSVEITAKDGNFGRSNVPKGTYADAIQKQRAKELGVALDRGSEFLGALANRTYVIP